jgi:hypothetical protein
VQRPELAVRARLRGARRLQHHALGDQRTHGRVAVLVLGEGEHRQAHHDRDGDRNSGVA